MAKIRSGKPHPRYGATPTQERHNAEIRDLKNQIFGRDCELENLRELEKSRRAQYLELERRIDLLEKPPLTTINQICAISVAEAVRVGLSEQIAHLAIYSARMMTRASIVASGNTGTP
jgi:hypothetical protein